jgi:Tol biopolymer transport system component
LRSSPDGNRIAFLMRDDHGIVQLWTVSPLGGDPVQWTFHAQSISSAFSWAPNGSWIAFILDNSVFVAGSTLGVSHRLTPRVPDPEAPRHHACVFSPDGRRIAYMRPVTNDQGTFDQIFVVDLPESLLRT